MLVSDKYSVKAHTNQWLLPLLSGIHLTRDTLLPQ
jgi:hypothetical protein